MGTPVGADKVSFLKPILKEEARLCVGLVSGYSRGRQAMTSEMSDDGRKKTGHNRAHNQGSQAVKKPACVNR